MFKHVFWALAVTPIFAQSFTGGLHVNAVAALGPLKTDEAGGINKSLSASLGGGHVAYAINETGEVACYFNAAAWKGDAVSPIPGLGLTNDYVFHQFGLDWRHQVNAAPAYGLVGGLNVTRAKRDLTVAPSPALGTFGSTTQYTQSGRPGIKLGGFYRPVSWFSAEGSLNYVILEKKGGTPDRLDSASWVQVSAVFHFGRKQ